MRRIGGLCGRRAHLGIQYRRRTYSKDDPEVYEDEIDVRSVQPRGQNQLTTLPIVFLLPDGTIAMNQMTIPGELADDQAEVPTDQESEEDLHFFQRGYPMVDSELNANEFIPGFLEDEDEDDNEDKNTPRWDQGGVTFEDEEIGDILSKIQDIRNYNPPFQEWLPHLDVDDNENE